MTITESDFLERLGYATEAQEDRRPGLAETLRLLVRDFLETAQTDQLKLWVVPPDFDLAWARKLVNEMEKLGVHLPQEAEDFLANSVVGGGSQTRWRAALTLWFIGLRIPMIRRMDEERRSKIGDRSPYIYEWADKLELGELNPEDLIREGE